MMNEDTRADATLEQKIQDFTRYAERLEAYAARDTQRAAELRASARLLQALLDEEVTA